MTGPMTGIQRWASGNALWLTLSAALILVLITLLAGAAGWHSSAVGAALMATLFTTLATGSGALPALFLRRISDHTQNSLLGFGAGVMLAASFVSLIAPALEAGAAQTGSMTGGILIVAAGLALGTLFLFAIGRLLLHGQHHDSQPSLPGLSGAWLFVLAITLHNLPEGLAVGVAQGDGTAGANALTAGIALQNMPEGLVIAIALRTIGLSPARAFCIALLTGMVEPLGGFLGASLISMMRDLLPWALAFAAGGMLFVISHEIIPEMHRGNNRHIATASIIAGFLLMILSDQLLA
ncbi:MAG: ZIP family metal transporter [Burkholderiales bacterium]|nr:ZIP family metal transporter [Burkholderiales bacterium]